eukprot:g34934.t1
MQIQQQILQQLQQQQLRQQQQQQQRYRRVLLLLANRRWNPCSPLIPSLSTGLFPLVRLQLVDQVCMVCRAGLVQDLAMVLRQQQSHTEIRRWK